MTDYTFDSQCIYVNVITWVNYQLDTVAMLSWPSTQSQSPIKLNQTSQSRKWSYYDRKHAEEVATSGLTKWQLAILTEISVCTVHDYFN